MNCGLLFVLAELVVVLSPSPEPPLGLSLCYEMAQTFGMCKTLERHIQMIFVNLFAMWDISGE